MENVSFRLNNREICTVIKNWATDKLPYTCEAYWKFTSHRILKIWKHSLFWEASYSEQVVEKDSLRS